MAWQYQVENVCGQGITNCLFVLSSSLPPILFVADGCPSLRMVLLGQRQCRNKIELNLTYRKGMSGTASALIVNPTLNSHLAFANHQPPLTDHGHTSAYNLSLVYHHPPEETVILSIVDRLSKSVHLIIFEKLPTAACFQASWVPTGGSFRPDQDPQLTSETWRAFCTLLNNNVSLSSGFHPQTNGQTESFNQELETALPLTTQPPCPHNSLGLSMNITLSPLPLQAFPILN